ncbi:MAG: hypothetical protein WAM11_10050, partial [Cyanobium sp.]
RLFRRYNVPSVIDCMSIDVEGAEDRVLLGFPFAEYKFNCITIERPSASLRGVLASNGCILIKQIPGLDCFCIHDSYAHAYQESLAQFNAKKLRYQRGAESREISCGAYP